MVSTLEPTHCSAGHPTSEGISNVCILSLTSDASHIQPERQRGKKKKKNCFSTHAQVFALTLRARFMCRWFASSIRVYRAERREVAHQVEAETKSFYFSLLEACFSIF